MHIKSIQLEGQFIRLEPLSFDHEVGLCKAVSDGELWKLMVTQVPHPNQVHQFIADAIEGYQLGVTMAFATIDINSNTVIGSTRLMNMSWEHKTLEIGTTSIAKKWQRTHVNTEAKLLMLTDAFERLNMNRVQFITDYLNFASRTAILRLGAKEEGLIRNHRIMADGRLRDSMIYSIIKNEWLGVKQHLSAKIQQRQ